MCSTEDPNTTCTTQGSCAQPQLFLQVPPDPQEGQALTYVSGRLLWQNIDGFIEPIYSTQISDI